MKNNKWGERQNGRKAAMGKDPGEGKKKGKRQKEIIGENDRREKGN